MSLVPLYDGNASHLLPRLSELTVSGGYDGDNMLASLQEFIGHRDGKIKVLTVAPSLEVENAEMFRVLRGLVPDFRVRDLSRIPTILIY